MTADMPLPPLPDVLSCDPRINGQLVHHIRTYAHAARAPLIAENAAHVERRAKYVAEGRRLLERAERAEARLAEAEGLLKEARQYIVDAGHDVSCLMQEDAEYCDCGQHTMLARIDAFLEEKK